MKRVVFLAAAAATLVQFTKYDLTALQTLGCEIHMVCNMQEGNISQAALQEYNQMFPQLHWHDPALFRQCGSRSPEPCRL